MKNLIKISSVVVALAVLAAGAVLLSEQVWQAPKTEKILVEDSISADESEINVIQKDAPILIDTDLQTEDEILHVNEKYGFSLKLPSEYRQLHYSTEERTFDDGNVVVIYFSVDTDNQYWASDRFDVFTISVYQIDYWKEHMFIDEDGYAFVIDSDNPFRKLYLGQNSEYAFTADVPQDCPGVSESSGSIMSVQCELYGDNKSVFKTFNVIN